ncbi:MAG: hypothetical protein E7052_10620 [Lentisphaerae bacterium]|nr:hypothetical protein [Lentisphaerota bacterium]
MSFFSIVKGFLLAAATLSAAVVLSGCTLEDIERALELDVPKEAKFMLSFHRDVVYPRGNLQAEQPLQMPNGRTRIIERYPILSSHNIVEIQPKPVPGKEGFYRLFMRLDQKGRLMWMQLTAQAQHESMAILLDGTYFGEFRTREVGRGSETWVELPLDVDAARALHIVKFANDNYRFFNGGKRDEQKNLNKI